MPFTPSHSKNTCPPPVLLQLLARSSPRLLPQVLSWLPTRWKSFTSGIALNHLCDIVGSGFCPLSKFPITTPRGSLGHVSVLVWLIIRKNQLSIIGLVSLYLTNYLILHGLIKQRILAFFRIWPELFGRFPRVTHPFATLFSIVLTSWARQATFS